METTYAYCHRCKKQHRRGTKIWTEHKESLGMYVSHPKRRSTAEIYLDRKRKY